MTILFYSPLELRIGVNGLPKLMSIVMKLIFDSSKGTIYLDSERELRCGADDLGYSCGCGLNNERIQVTNITVKKLAIHSFDN